MSCHSVKAVVDLGDAHCDQFFQSRINGSGTHGSFQQLYALLHQFRPVSHSTKEGRHSAERYRFSLGNLYIIVGWYARHSFISSFACVSDSTWMFLCYLHSNRDGIWVQASSLYSVSPFVSGEEREKGSTKDYGLIFIDQYSILYM